MVTVQHVQYSSYSITECLLKGLKCTLFLLGLPLKKCPRDVSLNATQLARIIRVNRHHRVPATDSGRNRRHARLRK